ncbi:MerR family transcriptional regulator [Nocardia sp. NPDC049526]|uniref:MerR family transcriptional regulator n=1 Tax=Nocardia sp. NPDC049526 TaxID=3364316 RepID=UPI0037A29FF8
MTVPTEGKEMLIGELAACTGTTTRALRFYEEQGLLTCERTTSGYRTYDENAIKQVNNIRELLDIGFTIDDVRAFLPYLDHDLPAVFPFEPRCVTGYAAVGPPRVAELNERITRLTELRDRLLDRMPWLAADAPTAQRDEIPSTDQV